MSQDKKCPECGEKMEQGYVISQGVFWSKEKHTQVALGQERMTPLEFWNLPNLEAYRCTNCRLVIFHYGYEEDRPTPKGFLKDCVGCGKEIPIASEECPHCGAKQKAKSKKLFKQG